MPVSQLQTPVLFIVFNRVDTTRKVFEKIREVRPKKLFIAADGPRVAKKGEAALCEDVRSIVSNIDWDCSLETLFRKENLGCGKAVSGAITWFFEHVEEGIILEDDTLPNESFFSFCESMLEKYRHDERIAQINGSNFQLQKKWGKASYYFSNYPMIWGWATWRRAWKEYEFDISTYPQIKHQPFFRSLFHSQKERNYWNQLFDKMYAGFQESKLVIDTWDYQWIYCCWKTRKISITPNTNLVTNIGFGADATHTHIKSIVAHLPVSPLATDIIHPESIIIHKGADKRLFQNYFYPKETLNEIRNTMYRFLPGGIMKVIQRVRRKFFPRLT